MVLKALVAVHHLNQHAFYPFRTAIQQRADAIRPFVGYRAPPDPFKGEAINDKVRSHAAKVLESMWGPDGPTPDLGLGYQAGSGVAPSSRFQDPLGGITSDDVDHFTATSRSRPGSRPVGGGGDVVRVVAQRSFPDPDHSGPNRVQHDHDPFRLPGSSPSRHNNNSLTRPTPTSNSNSTPTPTPTSMMNEVVLDAVSALSGYGRTGPGPRPSGKPTRAELRAFVTRTRGCINLARNRRSGELLYIVVLDRFSVVYTSYLLSFTPSH